jgi:hypothetical protein
MCIAIVVWSVECGISKTLYFARCIRNVCTGVLVHLLLGMNKLYSIIGPFLRGTTVKYHIYVSVEATGAVHFGTKSLPALYS